MLASRTPQHSHTSHPPIRFKFRMKFRTPELCEVFFVSKFSLFRCADDGTIYSRVLLFHEKLCVPTNAQCTVFERFCNWRKYYVVNLLVPLQFDARQTRPVWRGCLTVRPNGIEHTYIQVTDSHKPIWWNKLCRIKCRTDSTWKWTKIFKFYLFMVLTTDTLDWFNCLICGPWDLPPNRNNRSIRFIWKKKSHF